MIIDSEQEQRSGKDAAKETGAKIENEMGRDL